MLKRYLLSHLLTGLRHFAQVLLRRWDRGYHDVEISCGGLEEELGEKTIGSGRRWARKCGARGSSFSSSTTGWTMVPHGSDVISDWYWYGDLVSR